MPTLIYLHGFLSSPQSSKAQDTAAWLRQHRPDWSYLCPLLSPYPQQAQQQLTELAEGLAEHDTYLIGSSLGGFWATYLAEAYGFKAILVNPAVYLQNRFHDLIDRELKHYHSGEVCILRQGDIDLMAALEPAALTKLNRYWLLAQTGDETLDYAEAVARYQGCRQTIEPGGNHSFVGFAQWLPKIVEFCEAPV